jgi:hypothetical protein
MEGIMKNLLWLWIILGVIAGLGVIFLCIPKTKKRYLAYILRQAPSLIARYFV